jgi:hypothetical protein
LGRTCARVREIRNADVEGRIILKLTIMEVVRVRELKPPSIECNNGPEGIDASGSTKAGNFLAKWTNIALKKPVSRISSVIKFKI